MWLHFMMQVAIRWIAPTVLIGCIILLIRLPILFDPPYYDFCLSFWAEADYLVRTDFDYYRLRYEEPFVHAPQGGRRVYMTSILPGVAALLMKLAPSPAWSFAYYRLFTFLVAGVMGTFLYRLCLPLVGSFRAILLIIFTMTMPAFSTQLDMLAMEIPVAAFATMTAYLVNREKWIPAVISSFGAYMMKASGLIVTLSLTATLLLLVISSILARRRAPYNALAFSILALLSEWGINQWGDTFTGQIMSGLPLAMAIVWAPDLTIWTIAALVSLLWMLRRSILDIDLQSEGRPFRETMTRLADLILQERTALFCAIGVVGVMAALHRGPHLPRYYAMAVPLVAVLLSQLVFSRGARQHRGPLTNSHLSPLQNIASRLQSSRDTGCGDSASGQLEDQRTPRFTRLLAVAIILNVANWSGAIFPSMEWGMETIAKIPAYSIARSGSFLERSHEYLQDLRSTQSLIKTLVQERKDETVVCAIPFNFMLAYPSFGYVEEPLTGYSISRTGDSIPEFQRADQLLLDRPIRAIYIRVASYFYFASNLIEVDKPSPQDEILYTDGDRFGNAMTMYRKRWPSDPPTEEERNRYFQRMASSPSRLAVHLTAVRWREGLMGCEKMLRDGAQDRTLSSDLRSEITIVADAIAAKRRVESAVHADSSHPPTPPGIDDLFERALEEFHRTDWDAGVSSCREFLGRL